MSTPISLLVASTLFVALYAAPVLADNPKNPEAHSHADEHDHDAAHSYSVGEPASATEANLTVAVAMEDSMTYAFTPDIASIQQGEVINFVVINNGKVNHEFSIGNQEDQKEHAAMMLRMPNMVHDDPNNVTLRPGESRSLAWRFSGDDLVVFACSVPGHYEVGMFKKTAIVAAEENAHGEHAL